MQSTLYSCQILKKLEFYRQLFGKYSNFMKIRPVRIDGRTDTMKLLVAFTKFAKAPTNRWPNCEAYKDLQYDIPVCAFRQSTERCSVPWPWLQHDSHWHLATCRPFAFPTRQTRRLIQSGTGTVPVGKELRNTRLQQVSYTTYNCTTTMASFQIKFIATFELMTQLRIVIYPFWHTVLRYHKIHKRNDINTPSFSFIRSCFTKK